MTQCSQCYGQTLLESTHSSHLLYVEPPGKYHGGDKCYQENASATPGPKAIDDPNDVYFEAPEERPMGHVDARVIVVESARPKLVAERVIGSPLEGVACFYETMKKELEGNYAPFAPLDTDDLERLKSLETPSGVSATASLKAMLDIHKQKKILESAFQCHSEDRDKGFSEHCDSLG